MKEIMSFVSKRGVMKGLRNTPYVHFQNAMLIGIPEGARKKLFTALRKQQMRYPLGTAHINAKNGVVNNGSYTYHHEFAIKLVWEGCLLNLDVETIPVTISQTNPVRSDVLVVKQVTLAEWLFVD